MEASEDEPHWRTSDAKGQNVTPKQRLPDQRSGLVLSTHEVARRAGTMKEVRTVVDAPEGIGVEVIKVLPGSPVELDLRLESVIEGVLVSGLARMTAHGECARCLTPLERDLEVDVQELYLYPGVEDDDEEACHLAGDLIDLEPLLRDAVVLDLPYTPLCRADCAGLCAQCGADLNADPDHAHDDAADPRWGDLLGWEQSSPEAAAPQGEA